MPVIFFPILAVQIDFSVVATLCKVVTPKVIGINEAETLPVGTFG